MKPLRTLAIIATTNDILAITVSRFKDIALNIETDVEKAIEAMSNGKYDLLLVDKALPKEDYNKLNKLAEVLFPDAAFVNVNMNDEEFLRFKLSGLLAKWSDAQQETTRRFLDNPNIGS